MQKEDKSYKSAENCETTVNNEKISDTMMLTVNRVKTQIGNCIFLQQKGMTRNLYNHSKQWFMQQCFT